MNNQIYIVDVFAEKKYSGNPLAVVVVHEALSDELMQKIASEMNFSETTFVEPDPVLDGGYSVRMFTPSKELAFAGHPILGTAYIVRKFIENKAKDIVQLNLAQNTVSVEFENKDEHAAGEICWFDAPPISLGETLPVEKMASILGISPEEINIDLPIQMASSGTSAMLVPLKSLNALRKCKFNLELYQPLMKQGFPALCYLFTEETREVSNDLSARFFFDANGIREDPATGNGAAFLGNYLLKHGYLNQQSYSLKIEQGHEVNRPSIVMLHAEKKEDEYRVRVGGRILSVSIGNLV